MDNKTMAKKIAQFCFKSQKSEDDVEFAVQLFLENLVIPKGNPEYCEKQLEEWILLFLDNKK